MLRAKTPRELGYRMPAEWKNHEATWINWPHNQTKQCRVKYFGSELVRVEDNVYVPLTAAIKGEKVRIVVDSLEMERHVKKKLSKRASLSNMEFYYAPNLDVWQRDHGATFVKHRKTGEVAMVSWVFNGWGKYYDLGQDTSIPLKLNEILKMPYFHGGMILEGGAIEVNGKGTLLTTKSALLNENRNQHLSKDTIEERLRDYLGAKNIVWLKKGIVGDDTDGHIDNLVRFADERTLVCLVSEDKSDENYPILEANLRTMKEATDQGGRKLEIVKLPSPGIVKGRKGRLAASYANFYITNSEVLLPIFGDKKKDDKAIGILTELFRKDRVIIPIYSKDLAESGGTIHCIAQQQPAAGFD